MHSAATHPTTTTTEAPPPTLDPLGDEGPQRSGREVAADENSPATVLHLLSTNGDPYTRTAVAGNVNADPATLRILAAENTDPESVRLMALATNPATPADVLDRIARTVKQLGVRNTATGRALLNNDSLSGPATLHAMSLADSHTRRRVLDNADVPADVLRHLVKDRSKALRERLARRSDLPVDVFKRLAADKTESVAATIAGNAAAPRAVITQLLTHASAHIRHIAGRNSVLTPATITELADDPRVRHGGRIQQVDASHRVGYVGHP